MATAVKLYLNLF